MKKRLDEILMEKGIASDRGDAFVKVTEGLIFVNGQKAISPAQQVHPSAKIEVRGGLPYVGRGALKLEAALREFRVSPEGKICADIGSATGGFVEILLKYGAKKVYAIDTARGKLALKLREDSRVIVMEESDIRDIRELPELIDLITIDVSLISLRDILPHTKRFLSEKGAIIALFKPQYETRDSKMLRHGVIKSESARNKLLDDFMLWAKEAHWIILDILKSPIRGGKGNVEYLMHLKP
jgi:23S rRNA (cytidine1920-2'-O)/16S rRNA (cytidine1409-2'-O)-methyltransferase